MSGIHHFDHSWGAVTYDGEATVLFNPHVDRVIHVDGGSQLRPILARFAPRWPRVAMVPPLPGDGRYAEGPRSRRQLLQDAIRADLALQRPYSPMTYLDEPVTPWLTRELNIAPRRQRGVIGRVLGWIRRKQR